MQLKRLNNLTPDIIFMQIASMHEELLSAGVLAKLGLNFLTKLYRAIACHSCSAVYILQEENDVLAFVACSTDTYNFYYHFLIKNWLTIISVIPKLCSLNMLLRGFSLLKYLSKKTDKQSCVSEILSIAVKENSHRRGLGKVLINSVKEYMKKNDINHFKVVAAHTQESAHKFYMANGGILSNTVDLGKLKSTIYYFNLN